MMIKLFVMWLFVSMIEQAFNNVFPRHPRVAKVAAWISISFGFFLLVFVTMVIGSALGFQSTEHENIRVYRLKFQETILPKHPHIASGLFGLVAMLGMVALYGGSMYFIEKYPQVANTLGLIFLFGTLAIAILDRLVTLFI